MTEKMTNRKERIQESAVTRDDVLKAMNELPEEWIENCYEGTETLRTEKTAETVIAEGNNKKVAKNVRFGSFGKTAVKWAVAATAALLLCGGGVAYAAKLGILQFTKSEDKENPGFTLKVETERIKAEELTGEIQEVEGFLRDYMAEEDYSQEFPSWIKRFETVEEARDYIGYAGMKETKVPGTIEEVNVRVFGDTEGKLGMVSLDVRAEENDIFINEGAVVFTQESPITSYGTGIRYSKDFFERVESAPDYRSEEYTTASGKTAVLVYEEKNEGNLWLVGAVVDGAVYYELSLIYYPKDLERAEEIMYEWCEQF